MGQPDHSTWFPLNAFMLPPTDPDIPLVACMWYVSLHFDRYFQFYLFYCLHLLPLPPLRFLFPYHLSILLHHSLPVHINVFKFYLKYLKVLIVFLF